jgi:hypothetical protein
MSKTQVLAFILSILGLIIPVVGLIFSVPALLMSIAQLKKNKSGMIVATRIISIVAIIVSVVVLISFYFFFSYLPEKQFQETKVSLILTPESSSANMPYDLDVLMSRFAMSSGKVEGVIKENKILLNVSLSDFDSQIYRYLINTSFFEAKIGNDVVFTGGEDITYVGTTGQDAGIYSCDQYSEGYSCQFRFIIYLSNSAAQRQATLTSDLSTNPSYGGKYLDKPLDLYVDNNLVDTLQIGTDLRGKFVSQIQISGSGNGLTTEEAYENAKINMKKLQISLKSGRHLSSNYLVN